MTKRKEKMSATALGRYVLFHALHAIRKQGQKMRFREIASVVEPILRADMQRDKDGKFPDDAFDDVGNKKLPRWKSQLHYQSIQLGQWGWIVKKDGFWELTERGLKKIEELETLHDFSSELLEGKKAQGGEAGQISVEASDDSVGDPDVAAQEIDIGDKESDARDEIDAYIGRMDGHTFQCLVAALLRGMGYYVSYVSPPNTPDAGIDIIAYKELAGMALKVEVKHRKDPTPASAIDRLRGKLGPQDIGVFVSTGGFVRGLEKSCREDRGSRIELIDLERFIDLWREHYHKMRESDQELMHMRRIYFLTGKTPSEEEKQS